MTTWEFWNQHTDETIEVDAEGFEEACHIAFGDWDYDYRDFELVSTTTND